jgi:hypothetical protein
MPGVKLTLDPSKYKVGHRQYNYQVVKRKSDGKKIWRRMETILKHKRNANKFKVGYKSNGFQVVLKSDGKTKKWKIIPFKRKR